MSNLKPGVSQRDIDEQLETGSEPQAETCEKCREPLGWYEKQALIKRPGASSRVIGAILCQRCREDGL